MRPQSDAKNKSLVLRIVWKLFPNTMTELWMEAFNKGMKSGATNERRDTHARLVQNHVKDFGKPSLTLGYEQAMKAALDEIRVVA